jgi:hypothetical protein
MLFIQAKDYIIPLNIPDSPANLDDVMRLKFAVIVIAVCRADTSHSRD